MKNLLYLCILLAPQAIISQVLYDQSNFLSGYGSTSNYMLDANALVQSADDFEVPVNETWTVTSVTVYGFRNVAGPSMDSVFVELFEDNSNMPGTSIYSGVHQLGPNAVTVTSTIVDLTIDIPDQVLSTGTYWLSVSGYTPGSSRWFWLGNEGAVLANEGIIIDYDDYFGIGATSWSTFSSVSVVDDNAAFAINGTSCCLGYKPTEQTTEEVSVYPNPANDVFYIQTPGTVSQISIYAINGSLILQTSVSNNQINVSTLEPGVYFFKAESSDGTLISRFVKE